MSKLAWHFVHYDWHLSKHGFGISPVKVYPGLTLRMNGPIKLCKRGFHASEYALDALKYARYPYLCRVMCKSIGTIGNDKFVCAERTVLWMADISSLFLPFGYWLSDHCAREVGDVTNDPYYKLLQYRKSLPAILSPFELVEFKNVVKDYRSYWRPSGTSDPLLHIWQELTFKVVHFGIYGDSDPELPSAVNSLLTNAHDLLAKVEDLTSHFRTIRDEFERRCLALAPEGHKE